MLVVDDNAGFRESLVMLLDTEELNVVGQGSNGEQAMDLVDTLSPDVVLMDVRMPTMDGIETTRRLKATHPTSGSWRSPARRTSVRCGTCSWRAPPATC